MLGTIAAGLRPLVPELAAQGICDLSLGGKKVSGNSVRCKREHLLYHGTLLYDFPLEMIGRCLAMPSRQPAYRQARPHEAFVANLPLDATILRAALRAAWAADEFCSGWPKRPPGGWLPKNTRVPSGTSNCRESGNDQADHASMVPVGARAALQKPELFLADKRLIQGQ